MKKLIAVAVVAVALTLAGCSAAPAGKVTAETSTPTSSATVFPYANSDAYFIKGVRMSSHGISGITDAELIAAGHKACKFYAEGMKSDDITTINGTTDSEPVPGWNNLVVTRNAGLVYCPEFLRAP